MQHSAKCLAQQAEMKRLHDEYVSKWPNYCRKCGGVGEVTWQENQSPIGSGYVWLETLSELCNKCAGLCTCPRCGERTGFDELTEEPRQWCEHCRWELGVTGGCPPASLEEPCECELSAEPEDMPY